MLKRESGRRPQRRQSDKTTRHTSASPLPRLAVPMKEKDEQKLKHLPTLVAMWEEEG